MATGRGGTAKSKKQVVSDFRRGEILEAARRVFARKGFERGIMDEIAREAAIAKGTVYLYFRSKTAIFKAVLDHEMKLQNQRTMERMETADTLREKMRAFSLARIESAETNRALFRVMDSESGGLAFTRTQYHNLLHEPVERLAEAIAEAARRGAIRQVPAEQTAWLIVDMTRGTIQRRLMGRSERTPQEDAEFLAEFLWTALAVPRRGRR
jgi:AcrR family transcriptional regulator